jgi:hypothetical protein
LNDIKKVINDSPLKLEQVFVRLLSATSSVETEKLVKALVDYYGGKWRLVGDRSNFPTIHTTSSAVTSIVERITNAIDAQLEAEAVYSPKLKEGCKSPRQFVEKRFGVANGYLVSLEDIKGKKERLVKDAGITITLRDGDAEDSSTIDVRDKGIGVAREEFPDTLLSLNQNNKINKWYLMGRFGQGGSTTYRFSPYTVIFSRRRRSLHELENDIAFTIVKYREASEGEKDGQYVYLVRNVDDFPFSVPADNINFEGGTLVRHVAYSLGKKYLLDFYGYMETYLFDPILPFWLREERSWETNKGQGRRIFGSRDRLSRTDSVEQKDEFDAVPDQGDIGSIIVRYWVFKRGTQNKEKLTFIDPEEPIVITYLGQTHAKLPRRLLANDCQLPNLYKDLVVQIDCDGLTDKGRRVMFTSTREVVTDEGRRLIKEALVNTLSEELAELDQQRQLEFLSEGVTKAKDEMRRKLAEMINRIRPGSFATSAIGTGTMPFRMKKAKKKRSRRSKPPLETKNFPTYIKIANEPEPLKFSKAWIGTWIEIESDAPDDYLSKAGSVLELGENTQKFCHLAFKHKDFKGGRLYLKAGVVGGPTVGTTFPFCVSLHLNSNILQNSDLEDCKTGIIVEPPSGGGEKKVPLDAPDIVAVKPSDPFWKENEWTEDNVAEVREGSNIVIYVSFGNKWLIGALSGSGYTLTKQELLRNKYLLHMAFYAYLQNKGLKDLGSNGLQKEGLGQTQSLSEVMLDKIRQDSLEWAARAILTAITSEQAFSKAEAQIDEIEPA